MGTGAGQKPIATNKCPVGHDNPPGRQFCQVCGRRIVAATPGSDLQADAASTEERQRLQGLLDAAQSDNQRMLQEVAALRKEVEAAKVNAAPPVPDGLIAGLEAKLREAEQRAAGEPQLLEWKQRWKAAVEKVAALEGRLAATMREFEAHKAAHGADQQQSSGSPANGPLPGDSSAAVWTGRKRRLLVIAGVITMLGGAGGFGLDRMIQSPGDQRRKISQLTAQIDGHLRSLKNLNGQLDSMQQQAAQLAVKLASETQLREKAQAESEGAAGAARQDAATAKRLTELQRQHPSWNYKGKTEGTLNWEGDVKSDKGVNITIDQGLNVQIADRDATTKTIAGDPLPKVPVVVQPNGKNVYILEPPNAKNKWDRVVFHIDKKGHANIQLNWSVF